MYCSLTEWFLRDLQIASCFIESNAFLKSTAATHMSVLHSLLLLAYEFVSDEGGPLLGMFF